MYFQIPLMVLVFLPAIDGLKVQWREASESLGASAWQYWRHVGGPLLAPAFLGALLLLFANALSAFATIEAWENQIAYIVPQQISTALNSEVGLSQRQRGRRPRPRHDHHGGHHHDRHTPCCSAGRRDGCGNVGRRDAAGRPGRAARAACRPAARRRLNLFRYVVFTVFGLFFLLPLLALLRFSLEGSKLGTWSVTRLDSRSSSYPGRRRC